MLFDTYHRQIKNSFSISKISLYLKAIHFHCKQCLHDLQFMKTRYSCRYCLQNEWTLAVFCFTRASTSTLTKSCISIKFLSFHLLISLFIKFELSERSTQKQKKIFFMFWTFTKYVNVQSMRKIAQIFVCFSESPNFTHIPVHE